MKSDAYLSIDLDYWNHQRSESARNFFRKMLAMMDDCSVDIVVNHQDLLPFVNDSRHNCTELINMDYHDDLSYDDIAYNNSRDGSWVAGVDWKEDGSYTWRYPHLSDKHCLNGVCGINTFQLSKKDKGYGKNKYGWKNVRCSHGSRIDYSRVRRIGISISPMYLEFGIIDFITCNLLRANFSHYSFHGDAFEWLTMMSEAKTANDLPDEFGKYRC